MLVVLPVSRQSLFCNKHFKPTVEGAEDTVPYAWLRETPTIVLDLTGGMVADDAVDEADEVPCDGELGGEATPSLHSLVFSHEGDARSVGTPSLHTIVPAPMLLRVARVLGLLRVLRPCIPTVLV